MKSSIIECKINKIDRISFINFYCGLEVKIEDDKIIYKINNNFTIKPNNEKNRILLQKEVKKIYGKIIHDALLYFCIRTEI